MTSYEEKAQSSKLIITVSLLVLIPLLESFIPGSLFGLQWRSPLFMAEIRGVLLFVKTVSILVALYLLLMSHQSITQYFTTRWNSRWGSKLYSATSYLLILLQLPFLLIGIFFVATGSDNEYLHLEKQLGDDTFYVFTSDPGAMGKAYDHFYLKCPKPLGFYQLQFIEKTAWVKSLDFHAAGNELMLISNIGDGVVKVSNIIDISTVNAC